MLDVPVLIAGGGPVGLSASIFLSAHGVRSLLVERHPGTAIHPKARGINARTMEIYRQYGVEQAIRAAGLPPERARYIIWARTLAGEELERRVPWRSTELARAISPTRNCLCAQDDLEPVLRAFAEQQGVGELRFGVELTAFEQDADGVTAHLTDRTDGATTAVRARYLIAADGAHSRIRQQLGIGMVGQADVYHSVNILLRADLSRWTADRPAALYFIENPEIKGTFLTINGSDRWGFLANDIIQRGESPEDYTPAHCLQVIRQAAGVPDLPVEILGVAPWVASARVAERYRAGRVLLAGDAAHHMPPTGGFGMNTGVQDAHNLAWKLAATLDGWAGAGLLDSYEAERLPYGRAITEQSLVNAASMGRGGPVTTTPPSRARPEYLNEQGMIFGAVYQSRAVLPDGTAPPPVVNPVTDYIPVARPGSRAPHVELVRAGRPISTLDLWGPGLALLAGPDGGAWVTAADALASEASIPLVAHRVTAGGDLRDPDGGWCAAYGVGPAGAVLVRPDGYVAWRAPELTAGPRAALHAALDRMLARDGESS